MRLWYRVWHPFPFVGLITVSLLGAIISLTMKNWRGEKSVGAQRIPHALPYDTSHPGDSGVAMLPAATTKHVDRSK